MDSSNPSSRTRHVIDLEGVHIIYDRTCVLELERLQIAQGERVFLIGRSGSGKTTLLRVIKDRVKPATGRVRVMGLELGKTNGAERPAIQRRIAMIDQEFHLVPRMRVISNVLNGCLGRVSPWKSLLSWYPRSEWKKAEEILKEVGLEDVEDRRVETLSGGQRQRTAIARALMQKADIILADEPISNLDPELAEDALELLVECADRRGVTLVVSLHQPSLARRFATRLIGLVEGRIIYEGTPEEYTEEVARRVYLGVLPEKVTAQEATDDGSLQTMAKKADPPNLRLLGS